MAWIFFAALLLLLVIFVVKFKEFRHRFGSFFIILLFAFLLASGYHVYTSNASDVGTFEGIIGFGKAYFAWLGVLAHNVGDISGYVVQHDWSAKNESVPSEEFSG